MRRHLTRLALAAAVTATLVLSGLGARDVAERLVFPDHAVTFNPFVRVEAAYLPSVIKSIQRGTVALAAGTTATATITAVDTTKCGLQMTGWDPAGGGVLDKAMAIRIALTNATTITATSQNAMTGTANFQVVCFVPTLIKSIQRGTMTTSTTATITSVNTAKALVVYNGLSMNTGNTNIGSISRVFLTNATTVTTNSVDVNLDTMSWEVWEFN